MFGAALSSSTIAVSFAAAVSRRHCRRVLRIARKISCSPSASACIFTATEPGSRLVGDITYIPTRQGWLYLAVVVDLFSRAVIGWQLGGSLHASLVTGLLGPNSNAHGPNEFLHIPTGKRVTEVVARALAAHAER